MKLGDPDNWQKEPFLGCPFDTDEMQEVQEAHGISVGDSILYQDIDTWKPGTVSNIGSNAKYLDGTPFTAFAVQTPDGFIAYKTEREVRKAS